MGALIIIILILINIPIYKIIFNTIFRSMDDFTESMRYVFTPDLFSLFRGEYTKDYFGELKISAFLGLSGLTVFLEYSFIQMIIRNFTG